MADQEIVRFAAMVAEELAGTYPGAPFDELRAWVRIAHQREAMVTELYRVSRIESRLGALDASGPAPVMRAAVSSIWAHEESHTRFLGTLRGLSASLAGITELQGRLEGLVTRSAVSGGLLGRALIAVGASLGRVPEFARDFKHMNLRELVLFHAELETTARQGYQRILELIQLLDPSGARTLEDTLGLTFHLDVAKIWGEEHFHEDAFRVMAGWVADDGVSLVEVPRIECAKILHDVCERDLSVEAVRQALMVDEEFCRDRDGQPVTKGDERASGWMSDGGLGPLFSEYGLPVPVLPSEEIAARFRA